MYQYCLFLSFSGNFECRATYAADGTGFFNVKIVFEFRIFIGISQLSSFIFFCPIRNATLWASIKRYQIISYHVTQLNILPIIVMCNFVLIKIIIINILTLSIFAIENFTRRN